MALPALIETFQQAGQGQVFAFYDQLDTSEQEELLSQAAEIDLAEIARLKADLIDGGDTAGEDWSQLQPAPYEALPEQGGSAADWDAAYAAGEEALRSGRVALFTVAGGQGTRLGYDGPKGTYPITPVRQATLFQVFAEKVLAASRRYGRPIRWLIMTSHQNHEATVDFFVEHSFWGLDPATVKFFRQGRMPAVDQDGKIMLATPAIIAMSPDGHGGSLRALERSGALDDLAEAGVDTISYIQVDNPLVRCIDPAFIGWHLRKGSEMSSKMVPKAYAAEKVGLFCTNAEGQTCVVEYSDLPMARQEEVDPETGSLHFLSGSIALHVLDREFVRRLAQSCAGLPFHLARKKIPTVDASGVVVSPTEPNGIKFEMFVFDALPAAKNPVVIETRRADDFSPVKNAEGVDSPATCQADLLRQYARWVLAQGGELAVDETGLPRITFEVVPSFGYDEGSFAEGWTGAPSPIVIAEGTVLA